ncbi:MAG TPA: hypothetical protein VJP40_01460 [bacterium]|nr:hypothetical protein [bacterium]
MGSLRKFSLISALFVVLGLMACGGGSPQPTETELIQFWAGSSINNGVPSSPSSSTGNNSNIVSNDTPAKQVMVGGTIAGEASGTVTISVHETEPCAKGYCPIESKGPLASTQISAPGYFSVVVPTRGEKLTVVAKSGALSGMHYLGELSTRVDGIEISLE